MLNTPLVSSNAARLTQVPGTVLSHILDRGVHWKILAMLMAPGRMTTMRMNIRMEVSKGVHRRGEKTRRYRTRIVDLMAAAATPYQIWTAFSHCPAVRG